MRSCAKPRRGRLKLSRSAFFTKPVLLNLRCAMDQTVKTPACPGFPARSGIPARLAPNVLRPLSQFRWFNPPLSTGVAAGCSPFISSTGLASGSASRGHTRPVLQPAHTVQKPARRSGHPVPENLAIAPVHNCARCIILCVMAHGKL